MILIAREIMSMQDEADVTDETDVTDEADER
jgi:hypothetical protein